MIVWPSVPGHTSILRRKCILMRSVLLIGRRSISSAQVTCANAEWAVEMKIEANPSPEQLKWIVLILLVAAGLGHEQILGLL